MNKTMPYSDAIQIDLQYLTADDRRLLLEKAEVERFAEGRTILTQGERRQALFAMLEGTARVERAHHGKGIAFARLGPGSLFGEMSFLREDSASASVVAETAVVVAAVAGKHVLALATSVPGFGARFYQSLAVELATRLDETASRLPPLLVEEVAQVTRFHRLRASLAAVESVPPTLVEHVEAFKSTMALADRVIASRQVEEDEARGLVADGCDLLSEALRTQVEKARELDERVGAYVFRETFAHFMQSPLLDRAFSKPRGYAGDFETIAMMYANQARGSGRLAPCVDRWALDLPPSRAVRNRRGMMTETIRELAARVDKPLRLTSLASGPARELFDLFADDPPEAHAICIDVDPFALERTAAEAHARGLTDRFTFARENVIRLMRNRGETHVEPQHLIYSLGLVDYLDDRLVVPLLDWIYDHLEPGGVSVIGNFDPRNPSKAFMDHVVEWRLIHRSPERLEDLYRRSRFREAEVDVRREEAGVQLFAFATRAE